MGIEPTDRDSRRGPTGFEDQAHHQTGSTSKASIITPYLASLVAANDLGRVGWPKELG